MTGTTPSPLPDVRRRPGLIGRFTVALGDLLAAGALVLGVGLLVAMLLLPSAGTGAFDGTSGPGWGRVAAHLAVGILGEAAGQWARRTARPVRTPVAGVTVGAVLVVLALSWWR
jgi:hypothetical protein